MSANASAALYWPAELGVASGTKRTSASTQLMSAFGSKADIDQRCGNVCYWRSAKIAVYQCALINCTPLRPLPLNQASQNAINVKPRPSPAGR